MYKKVYYCTNSIARRKSAMIYKLSIKKIAGILSAVMTITISGFILGTTGGCAFDPNKDVIDAPDTTTYKIKGKISFRSSNGILTPPYPKVKVVLKDTVNSFESDSVNSDTATGTYRVISLKGKIMPTILVSFEDLSSPKKYESKDTIVVYSSTDILLNYEKTINVVLVEKTTP
jgi:hypothetical protein